LRRRLKDLSFRTFLVLDRGRVHLLPKHYYTPVADQTWLRANRSLWQRPAPLKGVRWNLDEQLAWVEEMTAGHYSEVEGLSRHAALSSDRVGPGYGAIESQVLHCFVRTAAPRRVVEVGGGMSTAIAVDAAHMNAAEGREETSVTTIDPFPRPAVADLPVNLIREPAQSVPLALFQQLGRGDLLFIDSTHTVKTGSEVLRLYLEIVPTLRPGVIVHVHDIYLPYLYSPDVLSSYLDWQETALVLALLTGNEHLRVLCCLSALHHERADRLQRILRDYRPRRLVDGLAGAEGDGHFPSSLWLETV